MRLLVTGGSGYLGSELVRRARVAGWEVTGTSSRVLDVRDRAAVDRAVADLAPDAVVHTAYRQDGPDFRAINFDGSAHVSRAAYSAGARLIHMSSDVVFDGRAGRPYVERDPPSPITDYGHSKAAAETVVAGGNPEALIVRTSLIYGGPNPSKHELAAREPERVFFTNELRCPIQVGDLADALLELLALDVSGPLHVAGSDGVSRWEFAGLVAGREPRSGEAPPDRPLDCRLDSSRATGLLRTRLRGVREVLG
jgi:dTDP-4-dehydrorhamnose reductase